MGQGGEAFLLDMGEQVRIVDLAEDLIRLSGLEPGRDIEIEFTGVRPGEKLSEELWEHDRIYEKTAHPDIVRSGSEDLSLENGLQAMLIGLREAVSGGDPSTIIATLQAAIPGAAISEAPAPDITAIM
jgi:FlaA1/EpsC-like NDP-sugar epimerase